MMEEHYRRIVTEITAGRVVPFLGAGVNLYARPAEVTFEPGCQYLPSGGELAAYLAEKFGYPSNEPTVRCPLCRSDTDTTGYFTSEDKVQCPLCKSEIHPGRDPRDSAGEAQDLMRVSQYVSVTTGDGPLYEELRALFDKDYAPTPLHRFFATLPATFRAKGLSPRYQLIVTTNYDDLLERAFREAEEAFDLVSYIAEGDHKGKFLHSPFGGESCLIEKPNEYRDLPLDRRTVILKIHGAVDRNNPEHDSYVITENNYFDYLARMDIFNPMPQTLMAKMRQSHFLFLGYSLRDWNLRVILHRIFGDRRRSYNSWAIQLYTDKVDDAIWRERKVDILGVRLEDYIAALEQRL